MASDAKVTPWTYFRLVWTLFWIGELLAIAIVDWPTTGRLWYVLCFDPSGVVHELAYLFALWAVVMDLTYWWQSRGHRDVRVFVVRPGGLGQDNQRKRERV